MSTIESLTHHSSTIILGGDFNCGLDHSNPNKVVQFHGWHSFLTSTALSLNLTLTNLSPSTPTRIKHTLDHAWVLTQPDPHVSFHSLSPTPFTSDHMMISIALRPSPHILAPPHPLLNRQPRPAFHRLLSSNSIDLQRAYATDVCNTLLYADFTLKTLTDTLLSSAMTILGPTRKQKANQHGKHPWWSNELTEKAKELKNARRALHNLRSNAATAATDIDQATQQSARLKDEFRDLRLKTMAAFERKHYARISISPDPTTDLAAHRAAPIATTARNAREILRAAGGDTTPRRSAIPHTDKEMQEAWARIIAAPPDPLLNIEERTRIAEQQLDDLLHQERAAQHRTDTPERNATSSQAQAQRPREEEEEEEDQDEEEMERLRMRNKERRVRRERERERDGG